jgi:hypothetical protein
MGRLDPCSGVKCHQESVAVRCSDGRAIDECDVVQCQLGCQLGTYDHHSFNREESIDTSPYELGTKFTLADGLSQLETNRIRLKLYNNTSISKQTPTYSVETGLLFSFPHES